MPKMNFQEQVHAVAQYVANRSPNWVPYGQIGYYLNCGATKAQNLCKTLDKLSDHFHYQNGSIQYNGKIDEWKEDLKHEG